MWPDEQQDGSSSSLSPSPGPDSPASHVRAGTTILINGSSIPASSNSSSSEETPVRQSTPLQVAHMAYYPVVLSRQLEQMQSDLVHAAAQDYSPPPPFSQGSNTSGTRSTGEPQGGTRLVAISNASLIAAAASPGTHFIDCGKCQVKEMEIRQLRKRVQALEEQLCRAIGSRTSSVKVLDPVVFGGKPHSVQPGLQQQQQQPLTLQVSQFVPPPQTLRTVPPSPLPPSSHEDEEDDSKLFKQRTPERAIGKSRGHSGLIGGHTVLPVIGHTASSSSSSEKTSISGESGSATVTKLSVLESQGMSGKHGKDDDDAIELVPGTNVFISTARLQQILSIVKTGKQLARKLMSVYWDRMILARSTLSAASQHYEQLDPKIISAIKTYCVLFDTSARKSEIHSTMIDKCVQARRPRRSSLKQQQESTTPRLQQVMDIGTIGRTLITTSVPVTPPPAPAQYIVSQVIGGKEQYHIEGAGTTSGIQQQPEVVHVTSPYQFTSHHHHSIHQLDTTTTTSGSLSDEDDDDEEEEEEEEESERVLTIHS